MGPVITLVGHVSTQARALPGLPPGPPLVWTFGSHPHAVHLPEEAKLCGKGSCPERSGNAQSGQGSSPPTRRSLAPLSVCGQSQALHSETGKLQTPGPTAARGPPGVASPGGSQVCGRASGLLCLVVEAKAPFAFPAQALAFASPEAGVRGRSAAPHFFSFL